MTEVWPLKFEKPFVQVSLYQNVDGQWRLDIGRHTAFNLKKWNYQLLAQCPPDDPQAAFDYVLNYQTNDALTVLKNMATNFADVYFIYQHHVYSLDAELIRLRSI